METFLAAGREQRFAVADGATESSYAGVWARLLAGSFCDGELDAASAEAFLEGVVRLEAPWLARVLAPGLPWFAEEKILHGASAAFCGLTLQCEAQSARWSAVAVGDACLALVREDELVQSFPWTSAAELGSRPILLSSTIRNRQRLLEHVRVTRGTVQPGDEAFLMTDGLAKWFLESAAEGDRPWHILSGLAQEEPRSFEAWVEELRATHVMRNDDVTLVAVRIP